MTFKNVITDQQVNYVKSFNMLKVIYRQVNEINLVVSPSLGNEGEKAVQKGDHEISNSSEKIWKENKSRVEILSNVGVTILVGKGNESIDCAVNIIWKSDLVASDETKDFNELSWAIQKDESGHVGNNTTESESITQKISDHQIGSSGNVCSSNRWSVGQRSQGIDQVVLELTWCSFKGLTGISNVRVLNGFGGTENLNCAAEENCQDQNVFAFHFLG